MILRLAGIRRESIVDGPGYRFAIYLQGCSHRCSGCHNPETHDPSGGSPMEVDLLVREIKKSDPLDGITITGGEPFEQLAAAAAICRAVCELGLNLVVYSGYQFEELLRKSRQDLDIRLILEKSWLLVDGPFIESQKDLTLAFRGSRNQRLIDLPRSMEASAPVIYAI